MNASGAFRPGFDCAEAAVMMGLCQQVAAGPGRKKPDPTIGHLPAPPLPGGWTRVVRPKTTVGLDNYWELWSNTSVVGEYAVVVRGTVLRAKSILDDVLLPMIPAQGSLQMALRRSCRAAQTPYVFSRNDFAAVHLGFAIGALALLFQDPKDGIWPQMQTFAGPQTRFFIAGHSQGGAIATLVRSFLEHQPVGDLTAERYKTYVFGAPKPGNDQYAFDFDRLTSLPGHAYRVANTEDWVPQVPPTLQWVRDVSTPNPLSSLIATRADADVEHTVSVVLRSLRPRARRHLIDARAATTATPLWPSLNYDRCGSPVPLAGKHGKNEKNKKDMLWQHHLGMYWHLLRDQLCNE